MSASQAPQVLLVGSEVVDKHALMCGIVGRPLDQSATSTPWKIDNRYYSADVVLQAADLESCSGDQAAASHEAVVLVFDAAKQETFSSLREWWEQQQADPAIKLAVAMGGSQLAQPPAWLEDAQSWCVEQLIEYVEVPVQPPEPSTEQQQQPAAIEAAAGSDGEEAQGVQRVVEALHAHTWPGLQLKPRGGGSGGAAQQQQQQGGGASAGAAPELGNGVGPAAGQANGVGHEQGQANGLELGEEEGDDLDRLFTELAGARDRLQVMGDAERRAAAASIVMRLMDALGLEDDADDGVESEESEAEEAAAR